MSSLVHLEHAISVRPNQTVVAHEWYPSESSGACLETIITLHGFTGDAQDFAPLAESTKQPFRWIAINYLGESPESISLQNCLSNIEAVFAHFNISEAHLLGYSMGGRIVLHFALAHLKKLLSLTLISTSPGILNAAERTSRLKQDQSLAQIALTQGTKSFIDFWQSTPLIATQQKYIPNNSYSELLERRYQLNKISLANALLNLSPAILPSLWHRLPEITIPTLLVTGEQDIKYANLLTQARPRFPNAEISIIASAGHAPHLENLSSFAHSLLSFLPQTTPQALKSP
ncbi:MAG: hypothetical protein COZ46_04765 [Verrucomicrobia bacterium CG_4_10_14_3_um_filter_43_23]|nr:MAG: hypothetical protein AUJ82_08360 [Verrucomicrobia bacterium CG1_02_43_26]PIP59916.1 MAG: hypothetical protein COX01_00800 [Verrucomicrobia bacterium CG22_combo_CG10-13_8_21_14_all_43_17]PIX58256.1 MAG: hypothetical protein COZ46_04765 [Verrucomicrobia bacterium CG_4_10_14_3_um_filter_43_23]PIY62442.1 MAG: hypothetical protein COY94_02075 [Verrucomicrobia bacterium CG_4_10_14_0_8_um_filter_43_34]PJA44448.1 MAG: hypothetical protein CO175_02700 [Verrucomicrobia bacterium CG_4_9_14_3_um_fi